MSAALDRDETATEFFARISSPQTPALDKLETFAANWKRSDLEERLAEATKSRDHYNALYRETRDMAAERETFQGRQATMSAAIRYKAQALVWEREVCSLTAQLRAEPAPDVVLSADQCSAVDETAGVAR